MNKLQLQLLNILFFGATLKWAVFVMMLILSLTAYTMMHPEAIKKTVYTYKVVNCQQVGDNMECTN